MSAPVTTRLAEVYRQAADVIREGGLCKRSYNLGTQHCTVGAIRKVTDRLDVGAEFLTPLMELLNDPSLLHCECGCGLTVDNSFDVVTRWNDRGETTAEDVVALFECAAERAGAEA